MLNPGCYRSILTPSRVSAATAAAPLVSVVSSRTSAARTNNSTGCQWVELVTLLSDACPLPYSWLLHRHMEHPVLQVLSPSTTACHLIWTVVNSCPTTLLTIIGFPRAFSVFLVTLLTSWITIPSLIDTRTSGNAPRAPGLLFIFIIPYWWLTHISTRTHVSGTAPFYSSPFTVAVRWW